MKFRPDKDGYATVHLMQDGTQMMFRVSRLLLEAFVGPCPEGMEACHIDGNLKNNAISNLRWDTHTGNIRDRRIHGTSPVGERAGGAKLKEGDVREIRSLHAIGRSMAYLARRYSVHPRTITHVITGRTWKHVQVESGESQ